MRKTLFIQLLCFISTALIAQKNFQPGFIVTSAGDTSKGEIDYRNWSANPDKIRFRNFKNEETELSLKDIVYFEIDGMDSYKRFIFFKDMQPVDVGSLQIQGDYITKDTAFLRTIVKGNQLSLYELIDEKRHFFIEPANDTLRELRYRIVLTAEGSSNFNTFYTFRQQLKEYTANISDSVEIRKKIDKSNYFEEQLRNIVIRINSGVPQVSDAAGNYIKQFHPFIGAGIHVSNLSFSGANETLNRLRANPYTSYLVNAGADYNFKRRRGNLFLRMELSYHDMNYSAEGERDALTYNGQKENLLYKVSVNTVAAHLYVNYTILHVSQNMKVNIGLGFGANKSSYAANQLIATNTSNGEIKTYDNYVNYDPYWTVFSATLGLRYKQHLQINISNSLLDSFANFVGMKADNKMTGFTVGYIF